MQLDAIRLFCDVASQRSVSRAAKLHGITQSAASQRVQALEKELGTTLIDRSKRPLHLTDAGRVYYRGTRKLLDHYERLCRQVADTRQPLRGDVTIAAIYSAGIDLLNQVQVSFEAEHPQTRIVIHYLHPEEVYQRVRQGQVDLGILSYPERWRDLASQPLRDEVMAVITQPDHGLAGAAPVSPEALDGVPLVTFDAQLPISRRIRDYLRSHGVQMLVEHSFDNIDSIKNCVVQRGGAAIVPARTAQPEARQGVLAVMPLTPLFVRPLAIVRHRTGSNSPAVTSFIDYLKEHQPQASTPGRQAPVEREVSAEPATLSH